MKVAPKTVVMFTPEELQLIMENTRPVWLPWLKRSGKVANRDDRQIFLILETRVTRPNYRAQHGFMGFSGS